MDRIRGLAPQDTLQQELLVAKCPDEDPAKTDSTECEAFVRNETSVHTKSELPPTHFPRSRNLHNHNAESVDYRLDDLAVKLLTGLWLADCSAAKGDNDCHHDAEPVDTHLQRPGKTGLC
jgi:hypothetical protein